MGRRDLSDCTFCAIVRDGTQLLLSTDTVAAFLDHHPVFPGHVLIVPTRHIPTLAELPADLMAPMLTTAQRFMAVLASELDAQGTFVAMNNVVSQSVAHLHLHVVPRRRGDGLRGFFWPRTKYADGEAADYGERLRSALGAT